jgi:curved DNA-binding protein CbpA
MALETQQNHYQVLSLERAADERAIKKAYFGLVRKFPPDKHPEEFKKIRAAYEVLSDPVARRRFDAVDRDYAEHGETVGATLRAAAEATRTGDEAKAQEHLRTLLAQRGDLLEAREMLGHSLMRARDFGGALAQFDELARARPDEGRYHLWRGYALEAKDQDATAEAAFRRASELRPDDAETRMALANVLASRRRYDESLAQIREALARLPDEPGARLHAELRLVDVLFQKGGTKDAASPALRELDALVARICRDPDRELWRYASSRLASLAALLFAREAFTAGNAVLSRCRRLNPSSLVEHPYPEKASLPLEQLPDRARKWLAARRPGPGSPTFLLSQWGASLWAFLASAALAAFTLFVFFHSPWNWGAAGYAFAAIFILGSCLALTGSVRAIAGALSSPVRPLVTVHPLYLVEAKSRRLVVYPLVNLGAVNLTRHTTNGVYTHTRVQVAFGGKKFETSMRDEAYAKGWAEYLLATRHRLLDLLNHGFLEAEPEVGVLPPGLLQPDARRFRWRPRLDRWLVAGTAAGLVLFALAIPWNRRLVDERAFGAAVAKGTLKAHGDYLAKHPSGRFAEAARAERARIHERARASLALTADPRAAGPAALLDGLRAMETRDETRLPVAVSWDAGERAAAATASDLDLGRALADPGQSRRSGELTARLARAFQQAGLGEVVRVEARPVAGAPLALTLHGRYDVEAADLEAGPLRLRSLGIGWRAALVDADGAPLFEWEAVTAAPSSLERAAPGPVVEGEWRRGAYEAELDAACAELAGRLATTLGLPADAALAGSPQASPYGAPLSRAEALALTKAMSGKGRGARP